MLTNTGITIFNAFSDKKSKKIVYVPHYIDAVWFHADQKTEIVNGGLNSADAYKIRIPYEKCENWISASEFRKSSGVSGKWTVQNGDFFMIGRWTGENVSVIFALWIPIVGIVLGTVSLVRVRKRNDLSGTAMAKAGKVLSIAGICIAVVNWILAIVLTFMTLA